MKLDPRIEEHRFLQGEYRSKPGDLHGALRIPGPCGTALVIIFTDGEGAVELGLWEHVSVSVHHRIPNWIEMCFVKNLFWAPEECVVQYHPPRSEYVSNHPNVLHLWRCTTQPFPMPPAILVGYKGLILP